MTYRNRRFREDPEEQGPRHHHGHWHDHDHRPEYGRGGGRGRRWRRRFGSREELISALERYQRNLEERAADVAESIRRLRSEQPAESGGSESPEGTDATPTTHNV